MSHKLFRASRKKRRGQGLVEYIFIVAAVAFIALVALSHFGHKVADQYAIGAGMLPGAHAEDNAAIVTGHFAGTEGDETTGLTGSGEVGWDAVNGSVVIQGDSNNVGNPTDGTAPAGGDVFVGE